MAKNAKLLVCIVGPTAIGKTSLAIELAKIFNTEIISADSRQFYKEISIGTAKPTVFELNQVTHHFINNLSIFDSYSVGDYEKESISLITQLFKIHDVLIVVGGSGLYVNAILNGFDDIPKASDEIRTKLNDDFAKYGLIYLQDKLKVIDPEYYASVDLKNPHRIIRALEVYLTTGLTISHYRKNNVKSRNFKSIVIGLNDNRDVLYQKIDNRVDEMIASGLVDEVKNLKNYQHLNALKTVGYTEIFDFINHNIPLDKAIELIKQNTRRFAKRQITWFKNQNNLIWFNPNNFDQIKKYVIDNF